MKGSSPTPLRRARKSAARAPSATASRPVRVGRAATSGEEIEEKIYRSIFDGVLNQRLPPGTRLPESALSDLFGASRATVRKVLQRLSHDHIVDQRPNRGAVVATPSVEETRQIFEARRKLESALVELAIEHNAGRDLGELHRLLDAERQAMDHFHQPAWAKLAASFHLGVAALAGNPILSKYLKELISQCALIVAIYEPAGNSACEHEEHARIVEAIAQGDAKTATEEMDRHLRALEERVNLGRSAQPRTLAQMLGMA